MNNKKMPAKKISAKQIDSDELVLHVRVAEPVAVRRTVLNLALDSIQLMKRYDRIMAIRSRKQAARSKLNNTYREIRKISSNIKLKELSGMQKPKQLPQMPMQKMASPKIEAEKKPLISKQDMSPLEKEMDDIRRKLSGL